MAVFEPLMMQPLRAIQTITPRWIETDLLIKTAYVFEP